MGRDFTIFTRTTRKKEIQGKSKIDTEEFYDSDHEDEFPLKSISGCNDVISDIVNWGERYFDDVDEIYEIIKDLINKIPYIERNYTLRSFSEAKLLALAEENYNNATYTKIENEKDEDIQDELRILKLKRDRVEDDIRDIKEAIAIFGIVATMVPTWVSYN